MNSIMTRVNYQGLRMREWIDSAIKLERICESLEGDDFYNEKMGTLNV